ncbi:Serine/threonine-protein kinase PknA [Rubripirellula tenax]|uniref:Serine/threonine-protein kinase PknA n=1 Tax=Rubripirellula tenax TaxID=2528015 RepID=A0A5C6FGC7_9BACT|nr:AAA family ATPase [Rubripirellula tenax]TWU59870.1 Serine/threonine-protein kinase PknA [Rubripirellula tenax]
MSDFLILDGDTPIRNPGDRETQGDTTREEPPWSEGDEFGHFVLTRLLGRGSSGFVYRVFDTATRRRHALKILRLNNADLLMRNRLGFRRMTQIEHPNLLYVDRIHKVGEFTALAMEEIRGVTLSKAIEQLKRLPSDQAFCRLLDLMRDFAAGLATMHAAGLIHRDIKPLNLMVGDDGRGKVIDYGLVDTFDLASPTAEVGNHILGTPHYLAPEVICRQIYLPAGDIFALGVVMLEALQVITLESTDVAEDLRLGGPGIERNSRSLIDAELILEALDDLSQHVPELIDQTCRQMLDRDPSERPTAHRLARLGLPPQAPTFRAEKSLIGRDLQLTQVTNWIDSVFDGGVSRIHMTGPSGIGKTRLLEEAIEYIESKHWGQVFRGRCRQREDSAMQAFEQICDEIASRYDQGDREKLQLDPVSYEILVGIFPFLKNVMTCRMDYPTPVAGASTRLNSLDAAARMSHQLRMVGPLFIVIDDSQWADQDSLNVLDRLRICGGDVGMGIITVSREAVDPQQLPADVTISLEPIDSKFVMEHIAKEAIRWSIPISDSALASLADATGGSPFRLQELSNEFRPGGALSKLDMNSDQDRSVTKLVSIDQLWQCRLDRLSDQAKQTLLFVVTAGGRVSTDQLASLTGLGDDVDAAISELSQLRLIVDEATGGYCISIFHDRFADQLSDSLGEDEKQSANAAWASLLVRQDDCATLAARIAGHWFAAGFPGRAVSHAILAAEDAERRIAKNEAARWHARVIDHLTGDEKIHHIREAANCYREADIPVEAARYYQMLAELASPQERFDCELLSSIMLVRSGRYPLVRQSLSRLAGKLGLPRPKHPWLAKLSILFSVLRLKLHHDSLVEDLTSETFESMTSGLPKLAGTSDKDRVSKSPRTDQQDKRRFDLCVSLVRPMSMFDTLYATELNIASARLARIQGTFEQRMNVAVGEAVFHSYDKDAKRIAAMSNLLKLLPAAKRSGLAKAKADVWVGFMFAHLIACRWEKVAIPLANSVREYRLVDSSFGFEVAHARWAGLWADWCQGRWVSMTTTSDEMFEDALQRNDFFRQQVTIGGLGGNAWLVRGRPTELARLRQRAFEPDDLGTNLGTSEILNFFDRVTRTYDSLYQGDFSSAWDLSVEIDGQLRHASFAKVQVFRVVGQSLSALAALQCYNSSLDPVWRTLVREKTRKLRAEQLPYTRVIANFYDGLLDFISAEQTGSGYDAAIDCLQRARIEAVEAKLLPIELAAADAISRLRTGQSSDSLKAQMAAQGVVSPDQLLLLYTIPLP